MHPAAVTRILGILLLMFGASLLPPLAIALLTQDGEARHFATSLALICLLGLALWLPNRSERTELSHRDGFLVVAFFWVGLGLIGAVPFIFGPHLAFVDAVFEAVSGFTTTGATVILGIDRLPPSILYYRQQLQYLGGMGVIVLAVAVLPLLGVGGMQLFKAETPGPLKDEKLTPRLAHTARVLWLLYTGMALACACAFWLAGMSPFDALGHAFAAVSTGGFSTHDASLGYYQSLNVELIAQVFMLAGGINFGIHFIAWGRPDLRVYLRDEEVRSFLLVVAAAVVLVTSGLYYSGKYASLLDALRFGSFEVISVITSTGFGIDDFSAWPGALAVFLILISFIGGCAGSTAGGIKVIRMLLLSKQGLTEIRHLIHPRAVRAVLFNGRMLSDRTVSTIWGFFSVYVATFSVLTLLMMSLGVDQVTAFSGVATCMNNMGPGLGKVSAHFHDVSAGTKLIGVLAMLLGRLEIFTILVLLSPAFWRS